MNAQIVDDLPPRDVEAIANGVVEFHIISDGVSGQLIGPFRRR